MFGWHMPTPAYLRDNIAAMEKQPFDGVCIRLPSAVGGGDVFDIQQWRETAQADRDAENGRAVRHPTQHDIDR